MKKKFCYVLMGILASVGIMPLVGFSEEKVSESSNVVESQSSNEDTQKIEESTTATDIQTSDTSSVSHEETNLIEESQVKIHYSIYNEKIGWQDGQEDGSSSSIPNSRIEAFKMNIEHPESETGTINYRAYVEGVGWQEFVNADEISGVSGARLEAVQIQLTGSLKDKYDIYYRVQAQHFGWLDWAVNGQEAGTIDFAYEVEGIQIKIIEKETTPPGATKRPFVEYKQPNIKYRSHVQNFGWLDSKVNGQTSGTVGQSKRMEALNVSIDNLPVAGGIEYRSHVQKIGWQNYVSDNAVSGTTNQAKQLEAVSIRLTGEATKHFDVYYRVLAKKFGWLDWASNGQDAGTVGFSYQIESIEIRLVKKNEEFSGSKMRYFVQFKQPDIVYQSHIQSIGWQVPSKNGQLSGTTGQRKRVEALKINIQNTPVPGGIEYRSHVQGIGWQNYVSNNQLSGTSGQAKRIEAYSIRLTGEMAQHFDVYYRSHTEYFGWLGWGNNGSISGTSAYGFRLEGLEIVIVKKGKTAPTISTHYQKAPADIKDYYLTAPQRVELRTKHYYTDRSLNKGNDISAGTVIQVNRRVIDKKGYPLLETPYGYITAHRKIVASTNKGQKTNMNVPYYNQMSMGYPNGCEEFSLYMALAYLGATRNQTIHQVTNAVPKVPSWGNPHDGFNGDPKQSGGFHTIYPKAFTPYAKRYAPHSKEISGVGMNKFKEELLKGNPIVVWGTYPYLAPPKVYSTYYGSWKVENLHVWLVTGFDGNTFYVADPIYGKLQVSEATVALSYSPNKMAVAIDK